MNHYGLIRNKRLESHEQPQPENAPSNRSPKTTAAKMQEIPPWVPGLPRGPGFLERSSRLLRQVAYYEFRRTNINVFGTKVAPTIDPGGLQKRAGERVGEKSRHRAKNASRSPQKQVLLRSTLTPGKIMKL